MKSARYFAIFVGIALVSLTLNLSLDRSNCIVGSCLTKNSAFHHIHVGMSLTDSGNFLHRAGVDAVPLVYAESFGARSCNVIMFSDFWRDYVIEIEPRTGVVIRKTFRFRTHGQGLLEIFRLLR